MQQALYCSHAQELYLMDSNSCALNLHPRLPHNPHGCPCRHSSLRALHLRRRRRHARKEILWLSRIAVLVWYQHVARRHVRKQLHWWIHATLGTLCWLWSRSWTWRIQCRIWCHGSAVLVSNPVRKTVFVARRQAAQPRNCCRWRVHRIRDSRLCGQPYAKLLLRHQENLKADLRSLFRAKIRQRGLPDQNWILWLSWVRYVHVWRKYWRLHGFRDDRKCAQRLHPQNFPQRLEFPRWPVRLRHPTPIKPRGRAFRLKSENTWCLKIQP